MGDNVNEELEVEYVYDDSKDLLTECIINQLNIVKAKQETNEDPTNEISAAVELYKLKNEADKIEATRQKKTDEDSIEEKKYQLEEKKVQNDVEKGARDSKERLIGIGAEFGVAIVTTIIGFVFYNKLDKRHLMYDKEGVLISKETQNFASKALPSLFKKK